jgi:predicted small lipoprotein YifL
MLGRRALAALAAAATTGVLALFSSGCGSSGPEAFHPAGKVSAAPDSNSSLAKFPFPPDVHVEFQSPVPADPQQAAVVTTDRDFQLAFYYAQYSQGKDQRFNGYIAPIATALARVVQSNVAPYAVDHKSIRGTLRIYDTTVTPVPGAPQNLTVTNCVDDSQLPDIDTRTGKPIPDPSAPSYTLESDAFKPMGGGKWGLIAISTSVYPQGNSKECKP